MPLARALPYTVFIAWVSICSFAPEFIWQGFVLLRGHFGPAEAYSALFIGTLFAFFVEPLMERLKAGQWRLPHGDTRGLLLSSLVSLAFGVLVVFLHEAMNAYLGGGHAGDESKRASLAAAIDQVREWASIPAAVTAAWFAAGTSRRLAVPAAVLACAWIIIVGHLYNWGWPALVTTAAPCCLIAVLGIRVARRCWDASTFATLARLTASIAGGWLVLAWLAEIALRHAGGPEIRFYSPDVFHEDLRFYLGWVLGLSVAPDPVAE